MPFLNKSEKDSSGRSRSSRTGLRLLRKVAAIVGTGEDNSSCGGGQWKQKEMS